MAKAGRGQTRRDSKRRVLRPGESIRADGKYQYKYHIDGKPHFVYSWKLEPTDKLPKGKKPCLSLRELEKQVNTDLDMLVNGPYTPLLKNRIINGTGHLSNEQCASALKRIYSHNLESIFLCHLSENNNTPDKAYKTIASALTQIGVKVGSDVTLAALPRRESSLLYTF